MPAPAATERAWTWVLALRWSTLRSLALPWLALLPLLLPADTAAQDATKTTAATAFYLRTDTDRTTVYTPRLRVSAPVAEETVLDLVYTTDVWTSASVDIRTSASLQLDEAGEPPEKRSVTEQRDELDVSFSQGVSDVTFGAGYRYSTEYDYESHGGSLGGSLDFADNNATVALSLRAYFDDVGRAGDPGFHRDSRQLGARASFNQVIDKETVAGVIYELTRQDGYLASPYRYVRIAAEAGEMPSTCRYTPRGCRPEQNPNARTRHAAALYARRALGSQLSLGGSYRFYLDDWDITSHTASLDAGFMPTDAWLLALGYRFYTQTSASHYEPYYLMMPEPKHYTSDKELTALSSHRVGVEVSRSFALDDLGSELRVTLQGGPTFYLYREFPLLDRISALEITISTGVSL